MSQTQAVIIKRKKGGHHGGHHGGAWKVAYADFVTAMMAFFLLLWLLNAVTDEQLHGIADYFAPISTTTQSSGASGVLSGETVTANRDMPDRLGPPSHAYDGPPRAGEAEVEPIDDGEDNGIHGHEPLDEELAPDALDELLRAREEQQFRAAAKQLRNAIAETPQFKVLAQSLLIDNSPEGLRIQIHDQDGLAMFPRGSAEMYLHTRKLLELVAGVIQQMPQQVAITGHTDSTPFSNDNGYSNWELSADRANAARRQLLAFKVPEARFSRVVGKAATDPLDDDDPTAAANRRLSVVLLRTTDGGSERLTVNGLAASANDEDRRLAAGTGTGTIPAEAERSVNAAAAAASPRP